MNHFINIHYNVPQMMLGSMYGILGWLWNHRIMVLWNHRIMVMWSNRNKVVWNLEIRLYGT